MQLRKILSWYIEAGVDECVGEAPIDRFEESKKNKKTVMTPPAPCRADDVSAKMAITAATKASDMDELDKTVTEFEGCGLQKTAEHTLTGIGVMNPKVMCIIEAPQAGDDKEGALLSDETGKLLASMLKAIDLSVDENAYVATLCPWRTPGDRALSPSEMEQCLPFLKRRIELVDPDVLLLFGSVVSGALIGIGSISKAREKSIDYTSDGLKSPIKTFTTFTPAFLIKTPAQKRKAWEDLQQVQKYLIGV